MWKKIDSMKVLDFTMSEGKKSPANEKENNSEESEIAALIHAETVWAPLLRAKWGSNTAAGRYRWFLTVYISRSERKKKPKPKRHFNLSLQKGAPFFSFLSINHLRSNPTCKLCPECELKARANWRWQKMWWWLSWQGGPLSSAESGELSNHKTPQRHPST